MPHPGQVMIPVSAPSDFSSFTNDDPGSFYSMYHTHWYKLCYLHLFHLDNPNTPIVFQSVEAGSFMDAFQAWEAVCNGITMRILRFNWPNGYDSIGYQFLSSGPVGVDIRLTAPDLKTASDRLILLRASRVRPRAPRQRRMQFEAAFKALLSGYPKRIAPVAPQMEFVQRSDNTDIVWMRQFIRDPYMATLRETKTGKVDVVFHAEEEFCFPVESRAAGLLRIDEIFKRLTLN